MTTPRRYLSPKVIAEEFTCPVCLSIYDQPQRLNTCNHTWVVWDLTCYPIHVRAGTQDLFISTRFCKLCLARLDYKTCPLCRKDFYSFNVIDDVQLSETITCIEFKCQKCHEIVSFWKRVKSNTVIVSSQTYSSKAQGQRLWRTQCRMFSKGFQAKSHNQWTQSNGELYLTAYWTEVCWISGHCPLEAHH